MHLYAFGSICRGEVSATSDIDLLAVVDNMDERFDPAVFSVYSYARIKAIWLEGNPFAWHLSTESRLLFSDNLHDFIAELGRPSPYVNAYRDCEKFMSLFEDARQSLLSSQRRSVFDLSIIFLSIRNLATCYSLGVTGQPSFSRHSALRLGGDSLSVDSSVYHTLEAARVLCTRGLGEPPSEEAVTAVLGELDNVRNWMKSLVQKARGR